MPPSNQKNVVPRGQKYIFMGNEKGTYRHCSQVHFSAETPPSLGPSRCSCLLTGAPAAAKEDSSWLLPGSRSWLAAPEVEGHLGDSGVCTTHCPGEGSQRQGQDSFLCPEVLPGSKGGEGFQAVPQTNPPSTPTDHHLLYSSHMRGGGAFPPSSP